MRKNVNPDLPDNLYATIAVRDFYIRVIIDAGLYPGFKKYQEDHPKIKSRYRCAICFLASIGKLALVNQLRYCGISNLNEASKIAKENW